MRPNDNPHVMLGDFDGSAIFKCPLTKGREKRQIASMRETFADKMKRLVEVIEDSLSIRLKLPNL